MARSGDTWRAPRGARLKPPLFPSQERGVKVFQQLGRGPSAFIPLGEVRAGGSSGVGASLPAGGAPPTLCTLGKGARGSVKEGFLYPHPSCWHPGGMGKGHPAQGHPVAVAGGCVSCFGGGGELLCCSTLVFSCPASASVSPLIQTWLSFSCLPLHPLKSLGLPMPGTLRPISAPTATVPDGSFFGRDSVWFRHRHGGGVERLAGG